MDFKLFLIGLVFLTIGAFSLYRVYKNPSSDELPYPSHDLSVKIGSVAMAAIGFLFIVSSL